VIGIVGGEDDSESVLDAKAQKIVGNTVATPGQTAPDPMVAAFRSDTINVQIAYCTSAAQRKQDLPELQVVEVPASIRTGPEYGIVILKDAKAPALDLALFILSPEGQAVLAKHGFAPVGLPVPKS
jgi:ABC-type molybdate transport system substrate-binding protein